MSRKLSFSDPPTEEFLFQAYSYFHDDEEFSVPLSAHSRTRARLDGLWLALVFASAHFLHSNRVPNPAVEGPFAAAIA